MNAKDDSIAVMTTETVPLMTTLKFMNMKTVVIKATSDRTGTHHREGLSMTEIPDTRIRTAVNATRRFDSKNLPASMLSLPSG